MVRRFELAIAELAAPLKKAKERFLVRSDVDAELVIGMLTASLLSSIMFTARLPDDEMVRKIVDHLIHSCNP